MSSLSETQTQEVYSLTPATRKLICDPPKIWGRLYPTYSKLLPYDLGKCECRFGRSEDCDIEVSEENMSKSQLRDISKVHFVINKDKHLTYITDCSKNGTYLNGSKIGRGNKMILQSDDIISVGTPAFKVYAFKQFNSGFEDVLPSFLKKQYQPSQLLGKGACAEVYLVHGKFNCLRYALKRIKKSKASSLLHKKMNHPDRIQDEIAIMRAVKHILIISTHDVFETDEYFYLILDYMAGGDLSKLIFSDVSYDEQDVKMIFHQISLAVQYLHTQGITHRDIKPENILLKELAPRTLIKISDFGLSKIDEFSMKTLCGTPAYAAPEILDRSKKSYSSQVDIWSLGVLLFIMISKQLPFLASSPKELSRAIITSKFTFIAMWILISEEYKDLVKNMLIFNPLERFNIANVLEHAWTNNDRDMKEEVDELIYKSRITVVLSTDSEESDVDEATCFVKRPKLSCTDSASSSDAGSLV